jgi:hypothetical protein
VDSQQLAGLCLALPGLRRQAAAHDATDRLSALVTAALESGVVGDELYELATAWLVPIEVDDDTNRDLAGLPLPRWSPFVQTYTCPAGRCARRWVRRPGVPPPWCDVHGAALTTSQP